MRTYELIGDCWLSQGKLVEARLEYKKIEASIRSAKINFLLGVPTFLKIELKQKNILSVRKNRMQNIFTQLRNNIIRLLI